LCKPSGKTADLTKNYWKSGISKGTFYRYKKILQRKSLM
jgi:ACT domain-containing protein